MFEVFGLLAVCPVCGSFDTERLPGPGLDIALLEFADWDAPGPD